MLSLFIFSTSPDDHILNQAKSGHGSHSSKIFVLFSKFLCRSVYCVCVNMYCATATGSAT